MKFVCSTDSQQLESHLDALLCRVLCADGAEGLSPLSESIRQYVLAGGKRVRPQLCMWAYRKARGDGEGLVQVLQSCRVKADGSDARALPASVLDLACAWELFHAFLLAHDDIIDEAGMRRDRPSLHRQLASLDGGCPKFGTGLGIVAGDLLFSAAIRLLHEIDLPPGPYREVLRLFSRIACTTGFGQAIDICQSHAPLDQVCEQTLLREYHWKTAAYTFEGPMLSGAILAGASHGAQDAISRYALALGQAYQLQNDLADLARPAHDGCDLIQGKRTVTLLRARAGMSQPARQDFDARLFALRSANGQAAALAERLRQELRATSALGDTEALIADFLRAARAAAGSPSLCEPMRAGLGQVLDTLQARYFVSQI